MAESTGLLKKLQIKSGLRLWLINVPREIAEALTAGAEVEPVGHGDACDGVIAFCANPVEAEAFARQAIARIPEDGLLWMVYRKGEAARVSGLSRHTGWGRLGELGYRPVRSISLDDTWTGLRFRPLGKVKAGAGAPADRR